MPEGYITESEVTYLNSKMKQQEKFNEVFNFYHETVPREIVAEDKVPMPTADETNTSVQTLDPAPAEEKTENTES